MAEVKYKLNAYEVDFKCDICGEGWYRPIRGGYDTMQYPHKCTVCGAEMVVAGQIYPYIVTERGEMVTE